MPWYDFLRRSGTVAAAAAPPPPQVVTAAATQVKSPAAQLLRHPSRWQHEVWEMYDALAEYNTGVGWHANMMSRVRLRAARLTPGSDEPEIVDSGPAADLIRRLGNVGSQAQLMRSFTVQLDVPGEGYLVGEEIGGVERWQVRSVDEVRTSGGGHQVSDENAVSEGQEWRPLGENSMLVRVWRPHERYHHLADSPARSARAVMRELELVNRKIVAEYLSRLASAGIFAVPSEIDFPVREEFADAPNPFMAEFIETASEAIKNPGTASSVVPIPIMAPAEALKSLQYIDFTSAMDEHIVERRDSAIQRLASKLDMPTEALTGMGDLSHWNAWQMDEDSLKVHIAPTAEIIAHSLTEGYLRPRLAASGAPDAGAWVVWYDMSELAVRPDKTRSATEAYDRMEIDGSAYRREIGFSETDRPTGAGLRDQALRILLAKVPTLAPGALQALTGETLMPMETGSRAATGNGKDPGEEPEEKKQPERPREPPEPRSAQRPEQQNRPTRASAEEERVRALLRQSRTQHALRLRPDGPWELMHPRLCTEHVYSCPFTLAVAREAPRARPGSSGVYFCHLDAFGGLLIDGPAVYQDTSHMISTVLEPGRRNGHVRT